MQSKRFVELLQKECVSVASSDVRYNGLSDAMKAKGEYQFLRRSLSGHAHGIHQGVFVVTPSGKLLKKINWGWPVPDVGEMHRQLEQSIVAYKKLSKGERLGVEVLKETDRSMRVADRKDVPAGWLRLRNTSRSYVFPEMELFDIRHPSYVTVDKLWFSGVEKLCFIPGVLKKGEKEVMKPEVVSRVLLNSHMITGRSAWWREHIRVADVGMEVVSAKGDQVEIRYRGKLKLVADSKWCKDTYDGSLLGKAVWDSGKKRFLSFEWVTLGSHGIDSLLSNMHRGTTKSVDVASLLRLDPYLKCERGMAPAHWPENYSREVVDALKW